MSLLPDVYWIPRNKGKRIHLLMTRTHRAHFYCGLDESFAFLLKIRLTQGERNMLIKAREFAGFRLCPKCHKAYKEVTDG